MSGKFIGFIKAGLLGVIIMAGKPARGQTDTLRYSIAGSEQVFLERNLLLLAGQLDISQADARIMQAKVWPNPTFTLDEVQLYINRTTDEIPAFFGNFWRNRNVAARLEQLVYTAGKRRKNIALELRNKELAQTVFQDMLQALKAEFRQTVAEIRYLQQVQEGWQLQLAEVSKLLRSQGRQLEAGNISEAQYYRLKALQISLQGELNGLAAQMTGQQKTLKTMINADARTYIVIQDTTSLQPESLLMRYTLDDLLLRSANNAALQGARNEVKISEAQLAIERANRVPDITFNASYDRFGSVMQDFAGVGFSMDLPFFNRNKGNIKGARIAVQQRLLAEQHKQADWKNTLIKKWTDLERSIRLYNTIDGDYITRLDELTKAIAQNFSLHHISLLEFLDFFESFRESREKYYEVVRNISIQQEDLNYLVGGEL